MSFIWEFATDAEMKGKFGYGFATFQIGFVPFGLGSDFGFLFGRFWFWI
jgi:hypothetical protein